MMSLKDNEGAPSSSSSSSSSSSWWKYDVFVSFRGEDTRKNFTDHLFKALDQRGIIVFRDDQRLERGKPISAELLKAIEESRFSIVVFSRNYATSSWCLDELAKIVECMKDNIGQTVLPVFYDVNPSEVRKHTGSFGKAFEEHEKAFGAEKLQKWRAALTEVSNLSGWDLQDRHEAIFIQNVVEQIWTKLSQSFSGVSKGLVGIDSLLKTMDSYLQIGSHDVRIIGICGMGGIGKTTIAKVIYDRYSHQFDGCSFLSDVREVSEKSNLAVLQEQLLSETLMERTINVWRVNRGIHKWLRNRRVLIILDDIDKLQQLEMLVGDRDWFGQGSRIIITTRDKHLLIAHRVDVIYEANSLDRNEALQLFSFRAFNQNHSLEDYMKLSEDIVSYANGLPLALKVLGSYLCGRSINEWRSALKSLKETPKKEIFDALKISYCGLEETEKKIFLDILCLFNLKKVDRVIEILGACEFYPEIALRVLIDKSLVSTKKVNKNECLDVHSLLQEMAQTIVYQESPKEPGRRSRLWTYNDIYHVLIKKTGTEAVEVIYLSSSQSKEISVDADAFIGMNNLRLLKVHDVLLHKGLDFLPEELRFLKWHGYPLKSLPSTFKQGKLVELDMSHSGIELLWKERVHLDKLKVIKLSHSRKLTRTPDFEGVPNLERLILEGCTRLYEVHPSIGDLKRLSLLNLRDCKSLQSLPRIVSGWRSLKFLLLLGCSKVDKLPENLGNCEDLEELDAGKTAITEAPPSIGTLKNLRKLSLGGCKRQTLKRGSWFPPLLTGGGLSPKSFSLPPQMACLLSLTELDLSYCNLSTIPSSIGNFPVLTMLKLTGNDFVSLPASINRLSKLEILSLADCRMLQTLTELPSSLSELDAANCSSLKTFIGPLGFFTSKSENQGLRSFHLKNCLRLLENQDGNDLALSSLKGHLDFSAKILVRNIFSEFLEHAENKESNEPHIGRVANFVRPWMSYLRQAASLSRDSDSDLSALQPGSAIPDWFTVQTTRTSISIELPPNWMRDRTFLGLAFCANFGIKRHRGHEPNERENEDKEKYLCGFCFSGPEDHSAGGSVWYPLDEERLPVSDHNFLHFQPYHSSGIRIRTHLKVTFRTDAQGFELKKFGARAVYLKDTEFVQTMFQGLDVPRLEEIIQLSQLQAATSTISDDVHYCISDDGGSDTGDEAVGSGSGSCEEGSENIPEVNL